MSKKNQNQDLGVLSYGYKPAADRIFSDSKVVKECDRRFLQSTLNSPAVNEKDRKKLMYKNILKFPKDTDYMKYFQSIPHRDRWPDRILAFAEHSTKKI